MLCLNSQSVANFYARSETACGSVCLPLEIYPFGIVFSEGLICQGAGLWSLAWWCMPIPPAAQGVEEAWAWIPGQPAQHRETHTNRHIKSTSSTFGLCWGTAQQAGTCLAYTESTLTFSTKKKLCWMQWAAVLSRPWGPQHCKRGRGQE